MTRISSGHTLIVCIFMRGGCTCSARAFHRAFSASSRPVARPNLCDQQSLSALPRARDLVVSTLATGRPTPSHKRHGEKPSPIRMQPALKMRKCGAGAEPRRCAVFEERHGRGAEVACGAQCKRRARQLQEDLRRGAGCQRARGRPVLRAPNLARRLASRRGEASPASPTWPCTRAC